MGIATLIIADAVLVDADRDIARMLSLQVQRQDRYTRVRGPRLADRGFARHAHIAQRDARPARDSRRWWRPKARQRDRCERLPADSQEPRRWRARTGGDEARQIYKERADSVECTNVHLRNRALRGFNVRGLRQARVPR